MTPETLGSDWLAPLAESPSQEESHRGVTGCQGQADLHQCAQCLWDINPSKGLRGSGGGWHPRDGGTLLCPSSFSGVGPGTKCVERRWAVLLMQTRRLGWGQGLEEPAMQIRQTATWRPPLPRPQLRAPGGDTQPAPGSLRPAGITGLGHCLPGGVETQRLPRSGHTFKIRTKTHTLSTGAHAMPGYQV